MEDMIRVDILNFFFFKHIPMKEKIMMRYDRVWAGSNAKNAFSVEVDK